MNIKKLMIEELEGKELVEAFHNLLAFEGLKTAVNGRLLSDYFIEVKLDPMKWRGVCSVFIGVPWELSELDAADVDLLQMVHEMLTV